MIVPSPEGNSRRTLLRAISGRRPVSGTVIRLEPERTATAAARRCRRAAVGHPGHHALPLAKAVAHPDADLVVEPDLDGALADLAGRVDHLADAADGDRTSVVEGKGVAVRGDTGGRRSIKKKK